MKFQDGTKPAGTVNPEDFTPERRAWLAEALKYYMQDFAVSQGTCQWVGHTAGTMHSTDVHGYVTGIPSASRAWR